MAHVSAGQDGIQKLLAAEKEAQEIVAKARKAKSDRLKQAKAEAEKEIEAYKQDRENAYQQKQSANTSNAGDTSKRLEEESKKAEADIKAGVSKNKQQVLDTLLNHVTAVKFSENGKK
mmetsp:Transcript_10194/g.30700  ORF Transcript_10194/g.30700 Transcript_10194/m.30700 type:complete len:118 (+) Transcript_10194:228-581(+)|eukprot:CAMPEP_0206137358 /NCGR_PEP_ID=MMETSP1473-20131121/2497_1 /ASSEMBLY_ACC=CAM_ASM_001109 /TAXON_ID=1461547 /ORGANISM="Stichococcus sp, Strain RCC1054" /LENGTH=117 /DNA_ID=CAMNT_0053530405 /DNA_START=218 /DNA_END=571 /DNA_ORIENTATION=-